MKKERVFTFKANEDLAETLDSIPNKSEFIRNAIEVALNKKCPLCNGTGTLTSAQHTHMQEFLTLHPLQKCDECDAVHFVCQTQEDKPLH